MPLLFFIVKHLFYIASVLVVWRCTNIQTKEYATDNNITGYETYSWVGSSVAWANIVDILMN
jgi:hypothetical protein